MKKWFSKIMVVAMAVLALGVASVSAMSAGTFDLSEIQNTPSRYVSVEAQPGTFVYFDKASIKAKKVSASRVEIDIDQYLIVPAGKTAIVNERRYYYDLNDRDNIIYKALKFIAINYEDGEEQVANVEDEDMFFRFVVGQTGYDYGNAIYSWAYGKSFWLNR